MLEVESIPESEPEPQLIGLPSLMDSHISHITKRCSLSLSLALSPSLPSPFINLNVSFVDAIQERNEFRAFKIIPEPSIIGNYIFHWEVTCHFSYFTSSEPIWEGNHHYDI